MSVGNKPPKTIIDLDEEGLLPEMKNLMSANNASINRLRLARRLMFPALVRPVGLATIPRRSVSFLRLLLSVTAPLGVHFANGWSAVPLLSMA